MGERHKMGNGGVGDDDALLLLHSKSVVHQTARGTGPETDVDHLFQMAERESRSAPFVIAIEKGAGSRDGLAGVPLACRGARRRSRAVRPWAMH